MGNSAEDMVTEFIRRRFPTDCRWVSGNCFFFAAILKARFPEAVVWYEVVGNHFFVRIGDADYDWTGRIERQPGWHCVRWDEMGEYDEYLRDAIIRDCIN